MKIHLILPGGREISVEREPMSNDKFEMVCWLVGGAIFALAVILILIFAR